MCLWDPCVNRDWSCRDEVGGCCACGSLIEGEHVGEGDIPIPVLAGPGQAAADAYNAALVARYPGTSAAMVPGVGEGVPDPVSQVDQVDQNTPKTAGQTGSNTPTPIDVKLVIGIIISIALLWKVIR
jgi:hypothetical protein